MFSSTSVQPTLRDLAAPEAELCARDETLRSIIVSAPEAWSQSADQNPLWGLISAVISQQISTKAALTLRSRVARRYPELMVGVVSNLSASGLLSCGLPARKAECCAYLATSADSIFEQVKTGRSWEEILLPIPG